MRLSLPSLNEGSEGERLSVRVREPTWKSLALNSDFLAHRPVARTQHRDVLSLNVRALQAAPTFGSLETGDGWGLGLTKSSIQIAT